MTKFTNLGVTAFHSWMTSPWVGQRLMPSLMNVCHALPLMIQGILNGYPLPLIQSINLLDAFKAYVPRISPAFCRRGFPCHWNFLFNGASGCRTRLRYSLQISSIRRFCRRAATTSPRPVIAVDACQAAPATGVPIGSRL